MTTHDEHTDSAPEAEPPADKPMFAINADTYFITFRSRHKLFLLLTVTPYLVLCKHG